MRERKEKPIVRALALMLAVFLACNLLPTMPRTTQAGEGDEGPAFTFTLVNGETALNVSGSYALKQGEETVVSGSFANGTATVTGFEEGSDYSLIITFEKGYAFDSNAQVFYKQPEATALSALVGGTNLSVTCEPYTTGLIVTGIVKAGEDPLVGAVASITSVDGHALGTPISADSDAEGAFAFSLAAPEGVSFAGEIKKNGYVSAAINATLSSEGTDLGMTELSVATVTFAPGANGSITCGETVYTASSETNQITPLGSVTFTVTPDEDYVIASVKAGSVELEVADKSSYTGTVDVFDHLTVSATFLKKDTRVPEISVVTLEDPAYFRPATSSTAWGGESANMIRLNLSDPQGEGEEVSGVKTLHIYKGDLGSAEAVLQDENHETVNNPASSYDVTIDSVGGIYSFVLTDGAGNHSELLMLTFSEDSEAPEISTLQLFSDETMTSNAGIIESANGYSSAATMYLHIGANDAGGAGVKSVTVYRRPAGSTQEFTVFNTHALSDNSVNIPIDAESFSTLTELALSVTDNAGNVSDTKTLAEWNKGLAKSAVIVASVPGGPEVTAAPDATPVVIGEGADAKNYFKAAPSYTVTLTDPAGETGVITVHSVSVNDTFLAADANGTTFAGEHLSGVAFVITDPADEQGAALYKEGLNTITVSCTNAQGLQTVKTVTFYVDSVAPDVKAYSIAGAAGVATNVLNGAFCANGQVEITVTAEDSESYASGIQKILVYNGEELYTTLTGTDMFTFPGTAEAETTYTAAFTFVAVDGVGNESEVYTPTNDGGGKVIVSTKAPVYEVTSNPEPMTDDDGKNWFTAAPEYTIGVTVPEFGVNQVEMWLNGDPENDVPTQTVSTNSLTVDLSGETPNNDGSYVITLRVTDGLQCVHEFYTVTAWIDNTKPVVTGFDVAPAGDGTTLREFSYGNYANGDLKVTVTAEDGAATGTEATAGVQKVKLFINGEEFKEETADENGTAVFTVSAADADANGLLVFSAVAIDGAGTESDETALEPYAYDETTGDIVSGNADFESEEFVIETTAPEIILTLPSAMDSGKKTIDNQIWYGGDITFTIQAKDLLSGMEELSISVNGTKLTADDSSVAIPDKYSGGTEPAAETEVFTFSTENITANDDTYTIEIVAEDSAGNTETVTETVKIDRKKPVVNSFTLAAEDAGGVIKHLEFGTYANGKIRITVAVSDEAPSSGLDKVTLTVNGTNYTATVQDGKAVFTLPEGTLSENYGNAYKITAFVTDKYGNVSDTKALDETTVSGMHGDEVRIDTGKPAVSATVAGSNKVTVGDKTWYSSEVIWTVKVSDAYSGIGSLTVTLNGTQITKDADGNALSSLIANGQIKDIEFKIKSSQVTANGTAYTLVVKAADYVGNEAEAYQNTAYCDTVKPQISGFKIETADGEQAGEAVAKPTDYGFYFMEDVTVVISAKDIGTGTGLKKIVAGLKSPDGTKSQEVTLTPDADGNVRYTVKAPFKGQVYAVAYDAVSNASEEATPKAFVLETADSHNGEAHVTFTKAATDFRQANGVELYSGNVDLTVTVTDTNSGIRQVEWSIIAPLDQGKNVTGTLTVENDGTIKGGDNWTADEKDQNLVTKLSRTFAITHDSNDIVVRIKITDRAGNKTEKQITLGIDKSVPTVEYTFDNNTSDPDYPNVYNDVRTMTVTVKERNFVAGDFVLNIKNADGNAPAISQWTEEKDEQNPNQNVYTATVSFVHDGTYTVGIGYSDRAGNAAQIAAVPAFVIDRSKPMIMVTYDNNRSKNGNYYSSTRTATVTVTERNFDVTRVNMNGNAQSIGNWTANGDRHEITVSYTEDGEYFFNISVTDKAGNVSEAFGEEQFIIDTKAPELTLTGVNDANKDAVEPVITCTDENYLEDGLRFTLLNSAGEVISKPYSEEEIAEEGISGMIIRYRNFDPMKENDDIYTLRISATDKAGNEAETIVKTFSVNRFGSTYDMTEAAKMNGQYLQNPEDIVFTEINVDDIDRDAVKIYVIKDSSPIELEYGKDFIVTPVATAGKSWKEYKYTISKNVFSEDGDYSIHVKSTDKAGNTNENDETGKNAMISFCVDRIAPNTIVLTPEDEKSYTQPYLTATIEIRDNYRLDSVKIYLNDKEVNYRQNGKYFTFEVAQSDSRQNLRIVAIDAAGNVAEKEVKNFLVSTSIWVRLLNNPAAILGISGGILGVLGAIVFILFRKRKNNYG
ncbi:MAG: Ig-like domain repeat protein [Lachnospiraceae bacterium]|nr:Ig-like domain repeat protein [Lachnospiraceae bacterium]